MRDDTLINEIEFFVETKMRQAEQRFERLIAAGEAVEARRHGKSMDDLKSVLKFIHARRRIECR